MPLTRVEALWITYLLDLWREWTPWWTTAVVYCMDKLRQQTDSQYSVFERFVDLQYNADGDRHQYLSHAVTIE